ncbi:MAG: hypothetical protein UW92_C0011G0006 [Candidatus Jorgensenbacteria bacterium GW2011_GWA2_45_13]|uniref:DUF4145 domain-containing protein n=1 Tax=Candidatus Jorgensenbacteria bacterium GW2011_GWA2_45_13 TaxID=1618662 RepID=A0A0G1P514_9BACT|nr:MAG: hypothetical protein UW92_C0011G0006 [Candidatus Jorgensenbacteria bacterium GW2011_GWA2_45_13]
MGGIIRSQLYKEEYNFIFSGKGSDVRRATVLSALIEWQVFSLASEYLSKRAVIHKPESNQEYSQSFNVLKMNKILTAEKLSQLQKFRIERNKSIHSIFKGMSRPEWEKQNKVVINLGWPIIKELDKLLFSAT